MVRKPRTVHVAKITNTVKGVTYTSYYLRRSFRLDGKVKHETLGNLSDLPVHVIDLISRSLKGEAFVPASEAFRTLRSLPHGHVEAILTMIRRLGLDDLIASRRSRQRDLVLAMIAERLLFPCSKPATTRNWHDTTLVEELHVEDATENELYAAMDWLLQRQKAIETKLAKRHLTNGCLVLYDVTSSYYEGETCPLARYGHDRDGKTGRPIIVYGVLTDAQGCPVAVQVYPGNTGDPSTVPDQVAKLSHQFGLSRVVLVGDRGMLTQTQINTLKKHPGLSWISALRSDAIRDLLRDGHLNRSLFDEVNLAEIESPEFPGERLIACYNPLLAEKRRRKREQLLAATEEILAKLARAVSLRTKKPLSSAEIGVKAGRVVGRHKMAKHIRLTIHDGIFTWSRDEDSIKREGMLDGIYVVRTSEPAERLSAPASVPRVQAAIAGGAVVPLPEGDRPAGAADLPSDRAPSARPCLDLRTGVLRGMAPASGLAITLIRGRGIGPGSRGARSGGAGAAVGLGAAEEEDASDRRGSAGAQFSDLAGALGWPQA